MRVRLAISPCPNDTFAFHGLLSGAVRVATEAGEPIELALELHDIETLNRGLLEGRFDVAKASFAAALALGARATVLRAGSALGFGVGPLLLASRRRAGASAGRIAPDARVLCPGEHTTAHLLYRLFHPGEGRVEHVLFSEILPALARGEAEYGVCIHEGRFTYERHGLERIEDLGATWESRTRSPLPLGGIVARDHVPAGTVRALDRAIVASLDHARAHPQAALVTMRAHARELDDAVLWKHVELYVNDWTRDLGPLGAQALEELARSARAAGLVATSVRALRVREPD